MKALFRNQIWHLLAIFCLIVGLQFLVTHFKLIADGALWGLKTQIWFWLAVLIPILHQIYVWLVWRLELYQKTFTSRYGLSRAFRGYSIGFSLLFVGSLIMIILLAISDPNTLPIHAWLATLIAVIITIPVIYLFYSVKKYFTMERAFGMDHFDWNYNKKFERRGIFQYTSNGMYIFGLMILYLPGLLFLSQLALIVALYNHLYIWVHYYCTELPDMKVIYGQAEFTTLTEP
ncbi:MAG: hypothetical protein HQ508_08740 [Candidatus Marinimicrobia bacterium]|nr:hypothetical protein [Candidatus Neomarinimicrobiota bacterium]